jgi:hypothetical protein
MSDVRAVFLLGTLFWFAGGAAFVASLVSGATIFAPFAAVLILLGVSYCIVALVWATAGRRPRDTDPLAH